MKEGKAATTDTNIESLWPDDFGTIEVMPPVAILRQQAYVLGQKTRNVLEGAVVLQSNPSLDIEEFFFIQAPFLGGYRYLLFTVNHKAIPIYPLTINPGDKLQESTKVADEEEFRNALRDIFASEATKKVVRSLLAQSLSEAAS